ncbi:MAG: DUF2892 domain-containing protein [Calditrichaeota bacterium]|nr:DUF2892 domain-containing protein [Calditrichota bacterium]MCB0304901.1 DUF2892 domain-containing protein [Calditrichota bacterium]MCB0315421.1 DUF2892 domain-containing protein [Calditrichota bacterium]MCB9087103.1 DUF2892 domain-containing protein [Calditrichia bacterium]
MKLNVGKTDKILRYVIGVAAIAAGVAYESWWGALGLIPIVTAAINWCPLYSVLKISSAKKSA